MWRLLMMTMLAGSVVLIGCEDTYDDTTTTDESVLNNDVPGDADVDAPPTADNPAQTTPYESLVARYNRVSDEFSDFTTWLDRAGDNVTDDLADLRDRAEDRLEEVRERLEDLRDDTGAMTAEARAEISAALDEIQNSVRRGLDRVRGVTPTTPPTTPPPAPNVPQ